MQHLKQGKLLTKVDYHRAAIPPYHYGLLHWAAAHALCLAGAIGGACGVLKYEALQHAKLLGQNRAPDWAVGSQS